MVPIGRKKIEDKGQPPAPGMKFIGGRWVRVEQRPKPAEPRITPQARKATEEGMARREAERRARSRAEAEEREQREAHELERRQIAWDLAVATGRFVPDDPIENEWIRRNFATHPEKYPRPT